MRQIAEHLGSVLEVVGWLSNGLRPDDVQIPQVREVVVLDHDGKAEREGRRSYPVV